MTRILPTVRDKIAFLVKLLALPSYVRVDMLCQGPDLKPRVKGLTEVAIFEGENKRGIKNALFEREIGGPDDPGRVVDNQFLR